MPHKPRVIIPENPAELINLDALILAQHQALGSSSPLTILEEPNWATQASQISQASALQKKIDAAELELKNLYGQRQEITNVLLPLTRKTRDLLMGVYASNYRRLGEFGFDVVEAAKAKTAPATNKQ